MASFPLYELVFGSLLVLIGLQSKREELLDKRHFFRSELAIESIQEFDFIIVGGGSSGCVVANRLSEKFSVLLIEAGGNPIESSYTPANGLVLHTSPDIAYQFLSEPQTYSGLAATGFKLDQNLGRIYTATGKGLGGTSILNGMNYIRGSHYDYDNWANITQDEDWKYSNLLEYFQKSEFHNPEEFNQSELGYNGTLHLTSGTHVLDEIGKIWEKSWTKAGEELGFKTYLEPNGPQISGFGGITANKQNGRRFSAFDAFVKHINRNNLVISRYSEATKIEFDENNKAVGVHYKKHGINQYARAKYEIIISAGVFNSPKILLLSGIGPKSDLENSGIPVIVDLPVGQRFQDHPMIKMCNFPVPKENIPFANSTDIFEDFSKNGKGPLALFVNQYSQAFLVSSQSSDQNWPDIQLVGMFKTSDLYKGNDEACIIILLGRPSSYGTLILNKSNPANEPLVWSPNYLSTENDVKILREGLTIAEKIHGTGAFQALQVEIDKTPINRCQEFEYGSEAYLNCLINGMSSGFHSVGSCPMGNIEDKSTVVDSKLRVKGVRGLRVIDNSIQPQIVNSHTHAASLVIGQRGAQFIINENYI